MQFFRATFLAALWIVSSIPAQASPAILQERFQAFYYSDQLSPRHCGRNVDRFAGALREEGILPEDFRVVSIKNHGGAWGWGQMLLALNSRWGQPMGGAFVEKWYFHVVGIHDGSVYDFSYAREPTVVPIREYIETMYIVPEGKTEILPYGTTFRVRGMGPAYLREHSLTEVSSMEFEVSIPVAPGEWTLEWKGQGPESLERYFPNRSKL